MDTLKMAIHIAICILILFVDSNMCEDKELKKEHEHILQKIERLLDENKRQNEQMTIIEEEYKRQNEEMTMIKEEIKQQYGRIQILSEETKRQDEMIQQLKKDAERQDDHMEKLQLEIKRLDSVNDLLKKANEKQRKDKTQNQEDGVDKEIVKETKEKRLLIDDPGHLQFEIDQLKSSVQTITSTKGGALYVQWGRHRCTNNHTETVYSGYAGGSYFNHTGGAAKYVCAPPDPDFGKNIPAAYSTYLFGAEYETDYFGQPWQEDVPCAVCRSVTATSPLMIPGKNHCFQNWKVEYRGRLASGHYTHRAASQYVCVDEHPEAIIGGNADTNGKLFYAVISECGALPCPPYKNNTELLCVVCSK